MEVVKEISYVTIESSRQHVRVNYRSTRAIYRRRANLLSVHALMMCNVISATSQASENANPTR